ncbi:MAG: LysM peptidoglycan-binding domain-containing protein [Aquiluna sp.]|nr:LysM peptidoglycan-binding domain-containing protein [Aquiluna sp.]
MITMSAVTSYRLTNPRRLFRGLAILALAASFTMVSISGSFAGSQEPGELQYVTVQSGDSLWSLADSYAPNEDPRDWIAEVVLLNALETAELTPGQQIALP